MFPKRYREASPPEYPDLRVRILANPEGSLYEILLLGDTSTPERAQELGAALSTAYAGATVEAYSVSFDFSTAEQAIATVQNNALPIDLRAWLRNAPIDLVTYERNEIKNSFPASLTPGI